MLDALLFGSDPTERIVAVSLLGEGGSGAAIRVWRRDEEDAVAHTDEPFFPFFFLKDAEALRVLARERVKLAALAGPGAYRYVAAYEDLKSYWQALRHVEETRGREGVYTVGSPEQQYLVQSGRTLFKGMTLDELHRLQFDIEVHAAGGSFPSARRAGDRIIAVALSDNRGWSAVLDGRGMDEREMLEALVAVIRERDPDVLEGHNCYAFDFPYVMARCRRHRVPFAIGRDGSVPRAFQSTVRFAERSIDYPALEVAGRHVIDTYFQVMSFDVGKRDLPGYGLKAAARYFGLEAPNRTHIDGKDLSRIWDSDPDRLLAYALDDVIETGRLARHLSGSTFYLTQMVPMPYGQCARTGPAAKIEALLVREYLRRRHALPARSSGTQTVGGYTDIFVTGVVRPVVYADVESLYPSIMLNFGVQPKGDALGLFPQILRQLTELRLQTKAASTTTEDPVECSELDARQNAFKIVINSFYGLLGFTHSLFNDFAEADRVAQTGQQLLRQIITLIRERGGTVVEVDTDGVLFVPPADVRGEDAERAFIARLSAEMPAGIRIGFDGRFRAMLSYKKKNYALERYDGRLVFKGSSLVSRSSERFGRLFVREAVRMLLASDVAALHELYLRARAAILEHDWPEGVASFQRTETLKDTVEQYVEDVTSGRRPRAAAYELAIARAAAGGQPARKGDRVSFYLTGHEPTVTAFEHARLADEWDPANPDENTAYYLRRLDEFAAKFEPFFETDHAFRQVFSPEDLFGFDPTGIRLAVNERLATGGPTTSDWRLATGTGD